jgi:cation transporter-like permease
LAGNVGCIFASRLSTAFHSKRDTETETSIKSRENLIVMGTLFAISIPIQLAFLGFVNILGIFKFGMVFFLAYLFMGALSVSSIVTLC